MYWNDFIEYLLKLECNHSTALFMGKNYKHNAKPREIIFPLNERKQKGEGLS